MKIRNVYIGGWFQRTMLQLSEIYDFLRDGKSQLPLNANKLLALRKQLSIEKVEYGVAGEEYIQFSTSFNIKVKIFEDGLIVLNNQDVGEETLFADIEKVTEYYEHRLSPAFSYLFSLGAPVPKELANIKNVYPYFVVCEKSTKEDMNTLLARTEKQQKYFEFENDKYEVIRGDKYYFINDKKLMIDKVERYIEEQIFIREFKGQLHRYLNIHRTVWEKIDIVKENTKVRGSDIVKFSTELEGYAKTVNLIDGRINQMSTYIPTREKIAKSDPDLEEFLEISGYRYETLKDTLDYVKSLWGMTKNYVQSAQKLFDGLKQDITSKSINSLTIVTSMSAGATILGLFTTKAAPVFSWFGVMYFAILVLLGWSVTKILKATSKRRKYKISDVEFVKIK